MVRGYVTVSMLESYLLLELTRQIAPLRSAVQHHTLLPASFLTWLYDEMKLGVAAFTL